MRFSSSACSPVRGWRGIRPFSTSSRRLRAPLIIPPPFPVTKTCPEPSCSCPPTPTMPEGFPIDYEQPLNGTMTAYSQQIVVCTGQKDWTSRIEDDGEGEGWGGLVRGLRQLMLRRGRYADPFNNILISASSFPASANSSSSVASALLFPSFKYFPSIPTDTSAESTDTNLSTFIRAHLLAENLHDAYLTLPGHIRKDLTRVPDLASKFPDAVDIQHSPTILICGHGGRDKRCGVMAPVLEREFRRVLRAHGFSTTGDSATAVDAPDHANIGLISHVGGHKYAGNVIVYIPPGLSTTSNQLAGNGIWYGRIEPKHVEGIVSETILGGKVLGDFFRGGIRKDGEILRIP